MKILTVFLIMGILAVVFAEDTYGWGSITGWERLAIFLLALFAFKMLWRSGNKPHIKK